MKPGFNFAPVSSAKSGLLRFASAWFLFNGVVYALGVVAEVVGLAFGHHIAAPPALVALGLLIEVIAAGGIIWTGLLLARGSRLGGFLAMGFVLLPIVFAAFSRAPLDGFHIAFAVLGVIILVAIWRELK
jgi:hypothetical protein